MRKGRKENVQFLPVYSILVPLLALICGLVGIKTGFFNCFNVFSIHNFKGGMVLVDTSGYRHSAPSGQLKNLPTERGHTRNIASCKARRLRLKNAPS